MSARRAAAVGRPARRALCRLHASDERKRDTRALHRELHDDRVLTFLNHVEPGIYHFRYLARATTPGRFVVPPLRAECMYAPEVNGRSGATTFEVAPEPTRVAQVAISKQSALQ